MWNMIDSEPDKKLPTLNTTLSSLQHFKQVGFRVFVVDFEIMSVKNSIHDCRVIRGNIVNAYNIISYIQDMRGCNWFAQVLGLFIFWFALIVWITVFRTNGSALVNIIWLILQNLVLPDMLPWYPKDWSSLDLFLSGKCWWWWGCGKVCVLWAMCCWICISYPKQVGYGPR